MFGQGLAKAGFGKKFDKGGGRFDNEKKPFNDYRGDQGGFDKEKFSRPDMEEKPMDKKPMEDEEDPMEKKEDEGGQEETIKEIIDLYDQLTPLVEKLRK